MTTPHEPRIARVAALMADPARSRMLAYLLSGEYASAGELAKAASVTPATASGHLRKLLDGALVIGESRGRHRYYRLAGPEVAHALAALALVAERPTHERAWAEPQRERLRFARCCYGHLAGRLGVALLDALLACDGLTPGTDGYALTLAGQAWLGELGVPPISAQGRRRFAYPCLDWSERRDHLAGQLAQHICLHFLEQGWLRREQGRALALTPIGAHRLGQSGLLPRLRLTNATSATTGMPSNHSIQDGGSGMTGDTQKMGSR
jgi:DNA-binding transcriptional ArsR family regulator